MKKILAFLLFALAASFGRADTKTNYVYVISNFYSQAFSESVVTQKVKNTHTNYFITNNVTTVNKIYNTTFKTNLSVNCNLSDAYVRAASNQANRASGYVTNASGFADSAAGSATAAASSASSASSSASSAAYQRTQAASECASALSTINARINWFDEHMGGRIDNYTWTTNIYVHYYYAEDSTARGQAETNAVDITNLQVRVTSLERTAAANENAITNLQGRATSLEGTAAENANNIAALQGRASSLEGTAAENANDITNLQGRATSLEGTAAENANAIANLQVRATSLEGTAAKDAKAITNLQGRATSLEGTAAENAVDITNLQGRVSSLDGLVALNANDITNLVDCIPFVGRSGSVDSDVFISLKRMGLSALGGNGNVYRIFYTAAQYSQAITGAYQDQYLDLVFGRVAVNADGDLEVHLKPSGSTDVIAAFSGANNVVKFKDAYLCNGTWHVIVSRYSNYVYHYTFADGYVFDGVKYLAPKNPESGTAPASMVSLYVMNTTKGSVRSTLDTFALKSEVSNMTNDILNLVEDVDDMSGQNITTLELVTANANAITNLQGRVNAHDGELVEHGDSISNLQNRVCSIEGYFDPCEVQCYTSVTYQCRSDPSWTFSIRSDRYTLYSGSRFFEILNQTVNSGSVNDVWVSSYRWVPTGSNYGLQIGMNRGSYGSSATYNVWNQFIDSFTVDIEWKNISVWVTDTYTFDKIQESVVGEGDCTNRLVKASNLFGDKYNVLKTDRQMLDDVIASNILAVSNWVNSTFQKQ